MLSDRDCCTLVNSTLSCTAMMSDTENGIFTRYFWTGSNMAWVFDSLLAPRTHPCWKHWPHPLVSSLACILLVLSVKGMVSSGSCAVQQTTSQQAEPWQLCQRSAFPAAAFLPGAAPAHTQSTCSLRSHRSSWDALSMQQEAMDSLHRWRRGCSSRPAAPAHPQCRPKCCCFNK